MKVSLPWGVPLLVASLCSFTYAQSQPTTQTQLVTAKASPADTVPRLIRYNGTMRNASGTAMFGAVNVTFSLYDAPTEGALLWSEKQTVQCNDQGHYTVLLGSTQGEGLPMEVFASRQARWLGITAEGETTEHDRVQLTSTPYALKAADADTLGGRPASAYALIPSASTEPAQSGSPTSAGNNKAAAGSANIINPNLTGTGSTNFIPLWTSSTNLGNSIIQQSSSGNIGIGVTNVNAKLVVKGNGVHTRIGDPACGTNFAGLGFGKGALSCTNYSIIGDGTNTYVNAPSSSGLLNLRIANQDYMTLGPDFFGVPTVSTDIFASFSDPVSIGSGTDNLFAFLKVDDDFNKGFPIAFSASSNNHGGMAILGSQFADSGGVGVMGINQNAQSPIAIMAVAGTSSTTGDIGVMSETSGSFGTSMWGLAGSGTGILAENTGSQGIDNALVALNDFANPLASVFVVLGSGGPDASCIIDGFGNLACSGTKSAVVPLGQGQKKVALYAVESPENWFEDFGSGTLVNGETTVRLDATFSQTVNTGMDYHVFLTPEGDCKGLYVQQKTAGSFEVHELGGGTSSVAFDYRIVARRKGYENVRLADKTQVWQNLRLTRQHIEQNRPNVAKYTALAAKSSNRKPFEHVKRPSR